MNLRTCKVLVTPTTFGKSDPGLRAALEQQVGQVVYNPTAKSLSSAQLAELLPGCDGYIAGVDQIDRNALASATDLKIIARYGVGVDNVDLAAAREKGILVTNTPGANSAAVAELTLGLILSLTRHIPEAVSSTQKGEWPRLAGTSIEGKCVGLLGFGAVSKQVAKRLAGFDCRIIAYDPFPDQETARLYHVEILPLEKIREQSDILSLHMPLLAETRGIINHDFLTKMKKGAYLINTARGELVDEKALLDAVQNGLLQGVALDVFTKEPPDKENPLLNHPRVLVTPHSGAHTDGAMNKMGWMALNECLSILAGKEPEYQVK